MISIIIPTYNRYAMLCEAIESILMQKDIELEILVIDDNSTDRTAEITQLHPQITYIKNDENKGPGYNRKVGYNLSKGDYIVFMDDDDYYVNDHFFSNAIQILKKQQSLSFVAANSYVKHEPSDELHKWPLNVSGYIDRIKYLENFQFKYFKPNSTFTAVFRKASLEEAKLSDMKMVNDSSIYMRALSVGDAYILESFIGVYRIHSQNISKSLDYNFLIENLDEKEYILHRNKQDMKHPGIWWFKQFRLTYGYFWGTKPQEADRMEVIRWGKRHLNNSPILALYLIFQIFAKLKLSNLKTKKQ